jgi:hypothetical protein
LKKDRERQMLETEYPNLIESDREHVKHYISYMRYIYTYILYRYMVYIHMVNLFIFCCAKETVVKNGTSNLRPLFRRLRCRMGNKNTPRATKTATRTQMPTQMPIFAGLLRLRMLCSGEAM